MVASPGREADPNGLLPLDHRGGPRVGVAEREARAYPLLLEVPI